MLLRWIGRDVFGDMRFAVYVPQRLSSRLLSARSNSSVGLAVPAAGTIAGINSTIDSIHRWRLRRFETCLRCPARRLTPDAFPESLGRRGANTLPAFLVPLPSLPDVSLRPDWS